MPDKVTIREVCMNPYLYGPWGTLANLWGIVDTSSSGGSMWGGKGG